MNLRPCKPLELQTPYQLLFGQAPKYDHLRTFGFLCYPSTAATSPHKLAPRSTRSIFLGYPIDHKGYKCLDLSTHKVILSRHVVFDESTFPFATEHATAPTPQPAAHDPSVSALDLVPVHRTIPSQQHNSHDPVPPGPTVPHAQHDSPTRTPLLQPTQNGSSTPSSVSLPPQPSSASTESVARDHSPPPIFRYASPAITEHHMTLLQNTSSQTPHHRRFVSNRR